MVAGGTTNIETTQIWNNIIYNTVDGGSQWATVIMMVDIPSYISLSNYNDFYETTQWLPISWNKNNYTFSEYQSASGFDANSISADPLFVDKANQDFHLQVNSPAKGKGLGGVDMGAYATGNEVIGPTTGIDGGGSGGGNQQPSSSGGGGDSSASGGSGCGFVKDNGKGQGAKGEGLAFAMMLIMVFAGIALARKVAFYIRISQSNRKMKNIFIITLLSTVFALPMGFSKSYAWTITADFEQGTIGQQAQGTSGFTDAFSQTLYSNEQVNSGTMSAKVIWTSGSDGWAKSGGVFNYPSLLGEGNEIWSRGCNYFKSPWSFFSNPVFKFLHRIHISDSTGKHIGYIGTLINSKGELEFENSVSSPQLQPEIGVYAKKDTWECYETYVKFSSVAGIVRIWKNGILIWEDITNETLRTSTDKADFDYNFTYWNGGAPQDQVNYVDDVIITSDPPANKDAAGNRMIGPIGSGGGGSGGDTPPPSSGSNGSGDSSASGGSGCGFVKDDGKGQGAKGEGISVIMLFLLLILFRIRRLRLKYLLLFFQG